jgi:hypothetical protein
MCEAFTNMCEARLKLNPEKCIFGITSGKVLRCLVSTKGIEANPEKIRAITQMQPPQSRKDDQKLMGHIASLNRFIAKLVERNLPFSTILRGSTKVDWWSKQQAAFEDLKQYLEHLPTLSSPEQGSLSSYMSLPCTQQSAELWSLRRKSRKMAKS